jgi:predicted acyltransferase
MTIAFRASEIDRTPSSTVAAPARMHSIDVFRGLIVAGMLLVTNAGDWNHVYWPLKHADWNGVTPTDMIFPSFLFLAGVSMTFSFAARRRKGANTAQLVRHVVVRSLLLIGIGLVLNGWPKYDLHNLRIPGVLQRIGLCYAVAGLFYLALTRKQNRGQASATALGGAAIGLMVSYWAMMKLVPVPGFGPGHLDNVGSLDAWIDRAVFGAQHLWFYGGQTWDPEGFLSTMTATCNVLLGIVTGEWLRTERPERRKLMGMAVAGLLLLAAGVALNPLIPINKKIWTPSFVLLSAGFSLVVLAALSVVVDRWRWRRGLTPSLVFGSNAILAFALANLLSPLEPLVQWNAGSHAQTLRGVVNGTLARWMSPWSASLGYALLFVAGNCAIVWLFYRKRVFLRI